MGNKETLKTELEQKYKAILDIPRDKIDFSFFVAIDEYIRLIDRSDYLKFSMSRFCDKIVVWKIYQITKN